MFYDQSVIKQVDVPSFSGSFGILPKHVPTLAVLKPGVVTVYEEDGSVKKIFVSSGTVTINENNSVQVCIYYNSIITITMYNNNNNNNVNYCC